MADHTTENDAVLVVLLPQIEAALAAGMSVTDAYTAARLLLPTCPIPPVVSARCRCAWCRVTPP